VACESYPSILFTHQLTKLIQSYQSIVFDSHQLPT
jgi:hypothetical protein